MTSVNDKHTIQDRSKGRIIGYWIVTLIVTFELVQGALWDFNLINKGYVHNILHHLGYPRYLGTILAVSKLAAAAVILIPGFQLLKEWAYAGVVILFTGAFVSHLAVGDGVEKFIWSLLFAILAISSWSLRLQERRLMLN